MAIVAIALFGESLGTIIEHFLLFDNSMIAAYGSGIKPQIQGAEEEQATIFLFDFLTGVLLTSDQRYYVAFAATLWDLELSFYLKLVQKNLNSAELTLSSRLAAAA